MLLKPDPFGQPRNPLAVYLLAVCFVSGTLNVLGVTTARAVGTLPYYVALTWALLLAFGSAVTLLGMYWQGTVFTGLLLRRVGLLSLAIAATIYGVVIVIAFGVAGVLPGGLVAGFALACWVHVVATNRRVNVLLHAIEGA